LIKLVSGNYAAFDRLGKRLATFPVGTRILKSKNDGLWIFFPPKPQFILSPELEEAIKRGLPSLK
jgi:hypothetical protein